MLTLIGNKTEGTFLSKCCQWNRGSWCPYTANFQSWFTEKLRYSSVASTSIWLFWDCFEKCYNHRQSSVKIANDYNIQQKNWENLEIMKNIFQNHRQISVGWTQSDDFSVNSAA